MILFHEIYGTYYRIVAELLTSCIERQTLSAQQAYQILAARTANASEALHRLYPEAQHNIMEGLFGPRNNGHGEYRLIDEGGVTHIEEAPEAICTTLEKRWLRTMLDDPRMKLFDIDATELADIEPLWHVDELQVIDMASDGDPFDNPEYIAHFRHLQSAQKSGQMLCIQWQTPEAASRKVSGRVEHLQYSQKEDKFSALFQTEQGLTAIPVAHITRIDDCKLENFGSSANHVGTDKTLRTVRFTLRNENAAFDRVATAFAMYQKSEAKMLNADKLYFEMIYPADEEPELIHTILGFGPYLRVLEPESIIEQLKSRLMRQLHIL